MMPPPPECSATFHLRHQWHGGFVADVTVTSIYQDYLEQWQVEFDGAADYSVVNEWNGVFQQNGDLLKIDNVGWNRLVSPGGTIGFGYQAAGDAQVPSTIRFNGVECAVHIQ